MINQRILLKKKKVGLGVQKIAINGINETDKQIKTLSDW